MCQGRACRLRDTHTASWSYSGFALATDQTSWSCSDYVTLLMELELIQLHLFYTEMSPGPSGSSSSRLPRQD